MGQNPLTLRFQTGALLTELNRRSNVCLILYCSLCFSDCACLQAQEGPGTPPADQEVLRLHDGVAEYQPPRGTDCPHV